MALLHVTSDTFEAFDAGASVLLVALDQSAAFDSIHHATLTDQLRHITYGLAGTALWVDWLKSYPCSRGSFVKWRTCNPDHITVDTGVPQGSSMGPQLFHMYIAPLAGLIRSFGARYHAPVRYHQYADDTQLCISMSRINSDVQLETLERCLLLHNGLALNAAKSDAVQFSMGRCRSRTDRIAAVDIFHIDIEPAAATIKSLGVILDQNLSFNKQVDVFILSLSLSLSLYITYKSLKTVQPSYLRSLLSIPSHRSTRYSSLITLLSLLVLQTDLSIILLLFCGTDSHLIYVTLLIISLLHLY